VTGAPLELLQREREDALAQVDRLSRDLAGVVAASQGSNADDEHDPEGATIGVERLAARPSARTCIACASSARRR
jgi:RNA polymerase-binding transcription factor DksA